MSKSERNKEFLAKANYPVYFGFILLIIFNFIYVFIEISKSMTLRSMGYDFIGNTGYTITQAEYEFITTFSDSASMFELAFLVVSLVFALFFSKTKKRASTAKIMARNFRLLLILLVLNLSLAIVFNAPYVNLIQILISHFY